MIELYEGFWCDPWEVKIVKKIDDKNCTLWITGEGYLEGHVIPYPAEEVVQAVIDARDGTEEEGIEEDE